MKLTMVVTDAKRQELKRVEKIINNNDLKKITLICPELYGKTAYQLKTKGEVTINFLDNVKAHFTLEK